MVSNVLINDYSGEREKNSKTTLWQGDSCSPGFYVLLEPEPHTMWKEHLCSC